jgi:hypothetical protein
VRPSFIQQRKAARHILHVGGAVIAAECVFLGAYTFFDQRRSTLIVVPGAIETARIVFSVRDGAPRRWEGLRRRYDIPPNGILLTQFGPDNGWFHESNVYPAIILRVYPGGQVDTLPGGWQAAGYLRSGCLYQFEEYAVGHPPRTVDEEPPWLDSLPTWGITCAGKQVLSATTSTPSDATSVLQPGPGTPHCWYDVHGRMTCRGSAAR